MIELAAAGIRVVVAAAGIRVVAAAAGIRVRAVKTGAEEAPLRTGSPGQLCPTQAAVVHPGRGDLVVPPRVMRGHDRSRGRSR